MINFKEPTSKNWKEITLLMEEFYQMDGYLFNKEKAKALFIHFLNEEKFGKSWLIYEKKELIGYVILTFTFSFEYQGKIAFLDELYLIKSARGRGIGKEVVRFIQEEAAKLSLKIIYLEVESHNEAAQKLYIASNFTMHPRKIMKYIVKTSKT